LAKSLFLQSVRDSLRLRGYAYATEKTNVHWITCFIKFHDNRPPKDMSSLEVESFLTHLAVNRNVAANTQNVAFNALIYLYRAVLKAPLEGVDACRSKKQRNTGSSK